MNLKPIVEEALQRYLPIQCPDELLAAAEVIAILKPKRVLELGTFRGGSLYVWTKCAAEDATIVGTDTPGTPVETISYLQTWLSPKQTGHFMLGDLKSPAFRKEMLSAVGGSIDFLFIDDDHHYDVVKENFEFWLPYVRSGGIIGFHDVEVDVPPNIEVRKLWNEIVPNFPDNHLFVIPATFGERLNITYGIGLIRKP